MIDTKLSEKLTHNRYFPCTLAVEDKTHVGTFRGGSLPHNPNVVIIGGEDTGVSFQLASTTTGKDAYIHCYGSNYRLTHQNFWDKNGVSSKIQVKNQPFDLIPKAHESGPIQFLYFGTERVGLKHFFSAWEERLKESVQYAEYKVGHPDPVIMIDANYIWGHGDATTPQGIEAEARDLLKNAGLKIYDSHITTIKPSAARALGFLYDMLNPRPYPAGRLLSFKVANK